MPGLNDDSYDDGGSPARQPPSPPRLVNLNIGDESLTTTLTKALHREDSMVAAMTPASSGNTLSSGASNGNFSSGKGCSDSDAANKAAMMADGSSVLSNQSNPYADSLGSNPYADSVHSSADNNNVGKTMEVTVTVLSLHGVVAKQSSASKKKLAKKQKKRAGTGRGGGANHAEIDRPTATIVASFSQNISKDRVFLTHVPSLPVSLTPSEPTSSFTASAFTDASSSITASSGSSGGEMLQPAVHWSSMDDEDAEAGNALSTLQFKRRYVPQTCPINLSISRNGRMAMLGKVNLIINGEERGKTSVTVPVTSSIRPQKSNNPVRQVKKIRNMGKHSPKQSKKQSKSKQQQDTAMVRIKGDTFQFGLKEGDAMLRMLVHVHDPDAPIPEEEAVEDDWGYSVNKDDDCRDDDSISDNEEDDSVSDNDCLSMEGDDPSILECNDYHNVNRFAMESNELHTIRQQLARSEQTNNILQMELANAQYSAQFSAQAFAQSQNEKGLVEMQLKLATANAETLLNELNFAKSESEALPFYETRVTELLEELRKRDLEVDHLSEEIKRKDMEVECLTEEIEELKGHYQKQLVDSLLWDNDDGGGDKDDGGGKDRVIERTSVPELGASLEPVAEEEDNDEDDLVQDETPKEAASLASSSDVDNNMTAGKQEMSDVAPSSSADDADVAPPKEEGDADSRGEEMRDDAPSTKSVAANEGKDASTKKEAKGGGWGIGLLGGTQSTASDANSGWGEEEETATTSPFKEALADDGNSENNDNDNGNDNGNINDIAASTTRQARGWGIRGLGASLLSMEERMRERQQQFQEQQLKEQRATELKTKEQREREAAAAQPGLGGVLISRLSNHGVKAMTTGAVVESDEETEETEEELANIEKASSGLSDTDVDGGESEHSDGDQSDRLESNAKSEEGSQSGVIGNTNESTAATGNDAPAEEGATDSFLVPSPSSGGTNVPAMEEPPTPSEGKSGADVKITPTILEVASFLLEDYHAPADDSERGSANGNAAYMVEDDDDTATEVEIKAVLGASRAEEEAEPENHIGEVNAFLAETGTDERSDAPDKEEGDEPTAEYKTPEAIVSPTDGTTNDEDPSKEVQEESSAASDAPMTKGVDGSAKEPQDAPPEVAVEVDSPIENYADDGTLFLKNHGGGRTSPAADSAAATSANEANDSEKESSEMAAGDVTPEEPGAQKISPATKNDIAKLKIQANSSKESYEVAEGDAMTEEPEASAGGDDVRAEKSGGAGWGFRRLGSKSHAAQGALDDGPTEEEDETASRYGSPNTPSEDDGDEALSERARGGWGFHRLGSSRSPAAREEMDGGTTGDESDAKVETTSTSSIPLEAAAADGEASPRKRGWGVRGIGARLRAAEGKMKERQRLFREQQLKEQREAERRAREAAAVAGPGLGGVLISRLSTHGDSRATTTALDNVVEESGDASSESMAEVQTREMSTSDPSNDANGDSDWSNSAHDTSTISVDDSLNDVLTKEAREHRRRSNQALLLESMDRLEEELLSGIIDYADETPTTDEKVFKEAHKESPTPREAGGASIEIAPADGPAENVATTADSDGNISNHTSIEIMDKSVKERVEEIEESLSSSSKDANDGQTAAAKLSISEIDAEDVNEDSDGAGSFFSCVDEADVEGRQIA